MGTWTFRELRIDHLETTSQEINLFTGLNSKVVGNIIECDTIAGKMKFSPSEKSVMGDVYRFISNYGSKLHKWGLENKIKELTLNK